MTTGMGRRLRIFRLPSDPVIGEKLVREGICGAYLGRAGYVGIENRGVHMKMIVAVDRNWGIGKKGELLISIPEDMKFFRKTTLNHVLVMGRKTLDSFPHGMPLKNRVNIVLTRDDHFAREGVVVAHSIAELNHVLADYDREEVYVIGGESIYRQMEPFCDLAYVTRIDYAYDADSHFPNLDQMEDWECTDRSEEQTYYDVEYYFTTYRRKL